MNFSKNSTMKSGTRAHNFWRSARQLFSDYTDHSTIHGVNYIVERNRSWFERIWWIVAFCISILGCVKLIFDAWYINPIVISFAGKTTPIWQVSYDQSNMMLGDWVHQVFRYRFRLSRYARQFLPTLKIYGIY
jgi:Amiloride-sensitive sodium channel